MHCCHVIIQIDSNAMILTHLYNKIYIVLTIDICILFSLNLSCIHILNFMGARPQCTDNFPNFFLYFGALIIFSFLLS